MYTIFSPANLARINDQSILAPGATMSLQDLFEWSRTAVYDDVASGATKIQHHDPLPRVAPTFDAAPEDFTHFAVDTR